MKKILFSLTLLLSIGKSHAQMQDLTSLANGNFLRFQPIYDKEKLYGYFALYGGGKTDDLHKKFEYILLDKNLNRVANKEFEAEVVVRSYSIKKRKEKYILTPSLDVSDYNIFNYGKIVYPSIKEIDIKNNTVSNRKNECFKDSGFYECPENKAIRDSRRDTKNERKEKGFVYDSEVYTLENGGYYVADREDWERFYKNSRIMIFDSTKKKLWEKKYNINSDKNNAEAYNIIALDSATVYYVHRSESNKDIKNELIAINLQDGSVKMKQSITEINDESLRTDKLDKSYGDKIFIVGRTVKPKTNITTGYYRIALDKKSNKAEINTFIWADAQKWVNISDNGEVEKGYSLKLRDAYILEDGSVGILTEKVKLGVSFWTGESTAKSTDIAYITTDSQFKIKNIDVLQKELSKGFYTDYLFSQYFNDDKDVAFFYMDYQKDGETKNKKWILFINTVVNDKFKQEQIQLSSKEDKFSILPFPAKEGYILLREFNEKEKYNQIRLEKLNY